MTKNEYYSQAFEFLKVTFPHQFFKKDPNSMELAFRDSSDSANFENSENSEDAMFLSLVTPYEYSKTTAFASWQEDLSDFFIRATSIVTDFSESTWEDVKAHVLPQIKGAGQLEGSIASLQEGLPAVVTTPFRDDLVVGYVIDQPTGFTYITEKLLDQWQLDIKELHKVAVHNLGQLPATVQGPNTIPNDDDTFSFSFESNDGYDAARILLDSVHTFLSKEFKGPYVVAIPCRDFMFATSPKYVLNLASFACGIFDENAHPITDQLLSFGDD